MKSICKFKSLPPYSGSLVLFSWSLEHTVCESQDPISVSLLQSLYGNNPPSSMCGSFCPQAKILSIQDSEHICTWCQMPNLYIFANIMLHTLTPGTPGPLTYILKYIIFTVSKIPFIPPLHGITEHQS